MACILGTGNATIDIVHSLTAYPAENEEVRCDSRVVCRGGNTANTLVVLSQLGHRCRFAGVLTDDGDGHFVGNDLTVSGVDTAFCRTMSRGAMPVSTVILNTTTGSRTIVHHRDLPEYRAADFHAIPLLNCDWLHFEGRDPDALAAMLGWAREHHPAIPVSLEIEKPRNGIEALFSQADVLLFSGDYARHHGYDEPAALLRGVSRLQTGADLYCTWGAAGAVSMDTAGAEYSQYALATGPVVDTLGAGDVFNAGVIDGYLGGRDMPGILHRACALAGKKCTQTGFAGLTAVD